MHLTLMEFELETEKPAPAKEPAKPAPLSPKRAGPHISRKLSRHRPLPYSKISRSLTLLIVVTGIFFAVCSSKRGALPSPKQVLPELKRAPIQKKIDQEKFTFLYAGKSYIVKPLAEYELFGEVVSHNDPTSVGDIYHDSTSVDVRDLCVVWGKNAVSPLLKEMTFWSEPWTCYFQAHNEAQFEAFDPEELSNNHLLAETEQVRRAIVGTHKGDQVHLRGWLVSYASSEFPQYPRTSSLVRSDDGNGACEVIFVKEFNVLKRATPGWQDWYYRSRAILVLLVILRVLAALIFPYLEYRERG